MKKQTTDHELLLRFKRGETSAFGEFLDRRGPGLQYYLREILRDKDLAEEAFQELVVAICKSLDTFSAIEDLQPYLLRTAKNISYKLLKKRGRMETVSMSSELDFPVELQSEEGTSRERAEEVGRALNRLEPELREAVMLRYFQKLSYEQMTRITGLSRNALFKRIQKAFEKLSKELKHS